MIILDEDKAQESLRMAQALYVNDILPPYTPPKSSHSLRQSRSHQQLSNATSSDHSVPPIPDTSFYNSVTSAMLTPPPVHPSHAQLKQAPKFRQAQGASSSGSSSCYHHHHQHGRSASIPPPTPPRSPGLYPLASLEPANNTSRQVPVHASNGGLSPSRYQAGPTLTLTPSPDVEPRSSPSLSRSTSSPSVGPGARPRRKSSSGSGSGSGSDRPTYTNVHMRSTLSSSSSQLRSADPSPRRRHDDSTTFFVGGGPARVYAHALQPAHTGRPLRTMPSSISSTSLTSASTTSSGGNSRDSNRTAVNYIRTRAPRTIRPTNRLSIHRDGAAITGTYVVDPELGVPAWFFGDETSDDEGYVSASGVSGELSGETDTEAVKGAQRGRDEKKAKQRANARFVTKSGNVDVDLWVCEGCVGARPGSGVGKSGSSADEGLGMSIEEVNDWRSWEALWLGDKWKQHGRASLEKFDGDRKGGGKESLIVEGTRHADVEVVSESGSVVMKLHAPSAQPLRVFICTQSPSGTINLAIPRTFVGPVYVYTCSLSMNAGRRSSQDDKQKGKEKEETAAPNPQHDIMADPTSNASLTSFSSVSTNNTHLVAPEQPFARLTPSHTGSTHSSSSGGSSMGSLTPTPSTLNFTAGMSAMTLSSNPMPCSNTPSSNPAGAHIAPADLALSILASYAPGAQFAKSMIAAGKVHTIFSTSSYTSSSSAWEKEKGRAVDVDKEKERERERADAVARKFGKGWSGITTVKKTVYFVGREGEAETWQAADMPVPGVDASHLSPFRPLSSLHIYTRSTASCVEITYSDSDTNTSFYNSDDYEVQTEKAGKFGLAMGMAGLTGNMPRGVANKLGKWLGKKEKG